MKPATLLLISLLILACGLPAVPLVTETPTAIVTVAPPTVTMATRVNTSAIEIDACQLTAVTDTNLRVCGGMACEIIRGDSIAEGEHVQAICTAGNEWALLPGRGYFCVAALIGTGGCE